jgi:hypothetical protein
MRVEQTGNKEPEEWGQTLIIDFKGFSRAIITDQGLTPDTKDKKRRGALGKNRHH